MFKLEKREDNTLLLGRNTVREAIKSGREIDAIYMTEAAEASAREILALAKTAGIPIKKAHKNKLDELTRFAGYDVKAANHQGIIARAAAIRYSTLEDAEKLAEQRGEPLFLVALDGVEDPHNLGAIVRSAEIFGAHGVVIPKRRSVGMTAAAAKTASGAEEYVPVIKVGNLPAFIDEVKGKGVFVATADMDGVSTDRANLTGAMMLIIGSEGQGISRLVKQKADFTIKIDMYGKINSLNASAAAAVLMYEKKRQDKAKQTRK